MDRKQKIKKFAQDNYFELATLSIAAITCATVASKYSHYLDNASARNRVLHNARLTVLEEMFYKITDPSVYTQPKIH